MEQYYFYILSDGEKNIFTGVTNNIAGALTEHSVNTSREAKHKKKLFKIVYYEKKGAYFNALKRYKETKKWSLKRKKDMIDSVNPEWLDVSTMLISDDEYRPLF